MKRAFVKKVRLREFEKGELVVKKIISIQKDGRGKCQIVEALMW